MPTNLSKLFSKNLRRIMNERDLSAAELSRALGIGKSTISNWMNAQRIPRDDALDALCSYLRITKSDLFDEVSTTQIYINPETAKIAQEVYDDPDLRLLFDASRNSRPEDIRMAAEMLRRFKETNPGG